MRKYILALGPLTREIVTDKINFVWSLVISEGWSMVEVIDL
jgi:hypothetical protein